MSDPFATQRIGKHGPLLLQDFHLIDSLAHFDRERIPERVVHAKGSGAFGYFETTHDISDICCSDMFSSIGKKTKAFVRFSTVGGEKGSADAARDPRGFAIKLYTEEGNLDWVYNNTPVFFLRDPSKFPHFIHTQKRNPETNLKDSNMFWDYLNNNQESIHQVMQLFSDRGTPASYRHMNGYSGHTYKWSNSKGEWFYVQVHLITNQGIKTLSNDEAVKLSGENPDHAQQDLFKSIENGDSPSWNVYIQTMTSKQAESLPFSVFDLTKVWPHDQFPLRQIGKLTLNENPNNYFAEVEQAAFSPSHTVPGQEPSADPVLQSRLFSYPDTHRHRLGTNYQQIPVNCPYHVHNPIQRDGAMQVNGNYGNQPNYLASNTPINFAKNIKQSEDHETWIGKAISYNWMVSITNEDYKQATKLWEVLGRQTNQQDHFIYNVAVHLCNANASIQDKTFEMFSKVHPDLGRRIKEETLKRSPVKL